MILRPQQRAYLSKFAAPEALGWQIRILSVQRIVLATTPWGGTPGTAWGRPEDASGTTSGTPWALWDPPGDPIGPPRRPRPPVRGAAAQELY